ncbi:MAG TPA: hypothetical protein VHM00_19160 [Caldimonas sp.]|nr:hypothetical protein [Caldimonas sp.]HEX2543189.1 hypothetical protein [Caldimonas sp.]
MPPPIPPQEPPRRAKRPDRRGTLLADALRAGRTREAIRALREKTGLGFEQARDAVEGSHRSDPHSGLSPGEVPRRTGWGRTVVVLLLLLALAYFWLRRQP